MSDLRRELLQSVVEVARVIFLAEAASVAVLDREANRFVFAAVAGAGSDDLVGTGFAAGQGLAGTVAQSGEPLIVDNLAGDGRFARDVAEGTGYLPNAMMVAPLLRGEHTLGVLSVLDRGATGRRPLEELEVLSRFADQAALSLEATALAPAAAAPAFDMSALEERLRTAPDDRRRSAEHLLAALSELLGPEPDELEHELER
jgi:GAF domain-containing protein